MSASKFFLIFLLLPIVLISLLSLTIYGKLYGKKHTIREKKHKKQTKKLLAHIHNFSPSRLKNRTWRKSIGRKPKKPTKTQKKQKLTYERTFNN